MKKKLLIIGAGGHGKVAADIAKKMCRWESIYFLDNDQSLTSVLGVQVIGRSTNWIQYVNDYDLFVAIGNNDVRKKIMAQLEVQQASIATLIHPSAVIAEQVDISSGSIVMAGAIINSCTSIGKGCIINTGSTVDHDCIIGGYVHICPGAHIAGNVSIGGLSWLGIGSTVINNIEISEKCTIGAGAVVIRNIIEQGTYLGIPARKGYAK